MGPHLAAGLVLTTMAEFQLIRIGPGRQGQELVSEANAKEGIPRPIARCTWAIVAVHRLRIAWAIREHHAIQTSHKVVIPGHPDDGDAAASRLRIILFLQPQSTTTTRFLPPG